jgi:hypothetical protein
MYLLLLEIAPFVSGLNHETLKLLWCCHFDSFRGFLLALSAIYDGYSITQIRPCRGLEKYQYSQDCKASRK